MPNTIMMYVVYVIPSETHHTNNETQHMVFTLSPSTILLFIYYKNNAKMYQKEHTVSRSRSRILHN